jgi:hypothetical protein
MAKWLRSASFSATGTSLIVSGLSNEGMWLFLIIAGLCHLLNYFLTPEDQW